MMFKNFKKISFKTKTIHATIHSDKTMAESLCSKIDTRFKAKKTQSLTSQGNLNPAAQKLTKPKNQKRL